MTGFCVACRAEEWFSGFYIYKKRRSSLTYVGGRRRLVSCPTNPEGAVHMGGFCPCGQVGRSHVEPSAPGRKTNRFWMGKWAGEFRETPETPVTSELLAERTGLEPATPGVTGRYSNQLNYRSKNFLPEKTLASPRGFEPRLSP